MKFMKLGTRPDTFYTQEATRTLTSDIASDIVIQINNFRFLLHKYPLVPKCGLLQRLCTDDDDKSSYTVELHDIPGGKGAFEICAKFCYGITLSLGAHNVVLAYCAAKYLCMTEAAEKGNFVLKLESFLDTCLLKGWKDSIATLQTTSKLPDWSENLGIIRRCIDAIVEMILTPPSKVTWSYTYTRSGYVRKNHQSVPKDWWTEDISNLDVELFQSIITAIKSTNMLPSQLIGEALHVYASRWLPDFTGNVSSESSTSTSQTEQFAKNRRVFESISSMIPAERGSISIGFLLKLLSISNHLKITSVIKDQLIRRSSLQLDEATVNDLLFASYMGSKKKIVDIDLVEAVLASFLVIWKRQVSAPVLHGSPFATSITRVGKLIDSYLQVVAKDSHMPVSKVVSLAEALPEIARPEHNDLYKAIHIYLKEHPDLSKEEKKALCRILDCQKLSKEVRAHAVKNERLPLRTVVQALYFDQPASS